MTASVKVAGVTTSTLYYPGVTATEHILDIVPDEEGVAWSQSYLLPAPTTGAEYDTGPAIVVVSPTRPTWTVGETVADVAGATLGEGGVVTTVLWSESGFTNGQSTVWTIRRVRVSGVFATVRGGNPSTDWPAVAIPITNPGAIPAGWWASGGHSPTHLVLGRTHTEPATFFRLGSVNAPIRAGMARNGIAWNRPAGARDYRSRVGQGAVAERTNPRRTWVDFSNGGTFTASSGGGFAPHLSTGLLLPPAGMWGRGFGSYLAGASNGQGRVIWPAWCDAPSVPWTAAAYAPGTGFDEYGDPYPVYSAPWSTTTTRVVGYVQWYAQGRAEGVAEDTPPTGSTVKLGAEVTVELDAAVTHAGRTVSGTWVPPWSPPPGARYACVWIRVEVITPPAPYDWGMTVAEYVETLASAYYPAYAAPSLDGSAVIAGAHGEPVAATP